MFGGRGTLAHRRASEPTAQAILGRPGNNASRSYGAALVASRYDPHLKAVKDRLPAGKKPCEVAIIATARKRLTRLNAMMASGQGWVTQTAPKPG